jgi:Na+-driven multidrug efflux pump
MLGALLTPLNRIAREVGCGLRERAAATFATITLAIVAIGFLTTAGFVILSGTIGVPLAALAFSLLFAFAAAVACLVGRAAAARRDARIEAARRSAAHRIAQSAGAKAGQNRSLLPLFTFVAAFLLARRS